MYKGWFKTLTNWSCLKLIATVEVSGSFRNSVNLFTTQADEATYLPPSWFAIIRPQSIHPRLHTPSHQTVRRKSEDTPTHRRSVHGQSWASQCSRWLTAYNIKYLKESDCRFIHVTRLSISGLSCSPVNLQKHTLKRWKRNQKLKSLAFAHFHFFSV